MTWGQFHMNWNLGCRATIHSCGNSGFNQCGMECLRKNHLGFGCGKYIYLQRYRAGRGFWNESYGSVGGKQNGLIMEDSL